MKLSAAFALANVTFSATATTIAFVLARIRFVFDQARHRHDCIGTFGGMSNHATKTIVAVMLGFNAAYGVEFFIAESKNAL